MLAVEDVIAYIQDRKHKIKSTAHTHTQNIYNCAVYSINSTTRKNASERIIQQNQTNSFNYQQYMNYYNCTVQTAPYSSL